MSSTQGHTVWAWGWNQFGQLGNGCKLTSTSPIEIPQTSLVNSVSAIAAGQFHNLALDAQGRIWAWGANQDGQLGSGNQIGSTLPHPLKHPHLHHGVQAIAAGGPHSLALHCDGTLWAWGANKYGQLGDGTFTNRTLPVPVDNSNLLGTVRAISAGGAHNLALKADGTLWAWGANCVGQLGDGTKFDRNTPVQVLAFGSQPKVIAMAAGNHHSLALRADGTLWAWGYNQFGQLGNDSQLTRLTPVQVDSTHFGDQIIAVAAGQDHSLALKSDGTVWAWGDNQSGQLGDGTTINRHTPVQVQPPHHIHRVVAIAAGSQHSLALNADGTLWAWGNNTQGQLGDGTELSKTTPIPVDSANLLGKVVTIAAGCYHSLLLSQ